MSGTTVRIGNSSTAIRAALVLAGIAGLALACSRKTPTSAPAAPLAVAKAPSPPDAQRPADAHPFPDPSFLVLIWMESTPPGAAIRRVLTNHVMGWTPETVEFPQAIKPEQVRFELEGYLPVTRDVPVASDGKLAVVLQPIPKKGATKKAKGGARAGSAP